MCNNCIIIFFGILFLLVVNSQVRENKKRKGIENNISMVSKQDVLKKEIDDMVLAILFSFVFVDQCTEIKRCHLIYFLSLFFTYLA